MEKLVVSIPPKPDPNDLDDLTQNNPYFDVYNDQSISTAAPEGDSGGSKGETPRHEKTSSETSETVKPPETGKIPAQKLPDCDSDTAEDSLFECGICTDDLSVPKSLPCLHNFCLDCLQKYFRVNGLTDGKTFACPTCRNSVSVPDGGPANFPTNFHIENLRKRDRQLDMGLTIKDAVTYLECRAEEIVDHLTETKRQVLISVGAQREKLLSRVEDAVDSLQEAVEEQYSVDSTKAVDTINSIKTKLSELQNQLNTSSSSSLDLADQSQTSDTPIRLNALTKLRRQAEIITSINNELEELKGEADRELSHLLDCQLAFCPGSLVQSQDVQRLLGRLVLVSDGQSQTVAEVVGRAEGSTAEGFSPLHVRSWSQSWWVLLFAVLPALICAMVVKLLMALFDKLL